MVGRELPLASFIPFDGNGWHDLSFTLPDRKQLVVIMPYGSLIVLVFFTEITDGHEIHL